MSAMMLAATSWPGREVCCASAACRAAVATLPGLRTPRVASQAVSRAATADGCRCLVAAEQDERAFVVGIVEGAFQRGESTGEHVAEPVEHAHSVGDQVGAVSGQQGQICGELGRDGDGAEVSPDAGGVGDDVGVSCVGLGFPG